MGLSRAVEQILSFFFSQTSNFKNSYYVNPIGINFSNIQVLNSHQLICDCVQFGSKNANFGTRQSKVKWLNHYFLLLLKAECRFMGPPSVVSIIRGP